MQKGVFQKVYPFTTEMVSKYFPLLNLKGKSLLTVGSSLDQAFHGLLHGASEVTVYDININVEKFYREKRYFVLNRPRKKFFSSIMKIKDIPFSSDVCPKDKIVKMNSYLENDYQYNLLRECLKKDENLHFLCGDIFHMDEVLENKKFDRIVFSNILQYLDFFANGEEPYSFLARQFKSWKSHLKEKGILQLLYLYSYDEEKIKKEHHAISSYNLKKVAEALKGNSLMIEWVYNDYLKGQDAIVTYQKR